MTATIRLSLTRTIAILIFITAAATLINPALAQDAISTATTPKEKAIQRLDTRKAAVEDKMEATKEKIETRITAVQNKLATREAQLRAKLDAFKDKRRAQIAERVNTNLNKINQNQTTQMKNQLDRMTVILAKLETRVSNGSPDIKDPSSANTAIASATATIASASAAVDAQTGKDYTLTVTSESTVKRDAQSMRNQLHTDLQSTRRLVISAKQSIANAIRTAKGEPLTKEASPSGQQ